MNKIIFFIFFTLPIIAFSQEEAKFYISLPQKNLNEAFVIIEETFDVKFSYQDEIISNQKVNLIGEQRTLNQTLNEIELQTNFKFEVIANRYIVVNNFSKDIIVQELDKVVLNSYLAKGITKQKDASFKIKPLQLSILPGLTEPDVLESIQLLPGVVSPNETASGLIVRGGLLDQNRMIWDGITIYHKGHLFGMISPFNPNATQNVTFINKGTNPRYGDRASSVIEMTTGSDISNSVKAQVGINAINVDAFLDIPILKNKLGIQTSIRSSYTNLFQSYTYDQITDKVFENTKIVGGVNTTNDFDFIDYNLKINFKPNPKNTFYASIIAIDNHLDYTVNDVSSNDNFNDNMSISNVGYSTGWHTQWHSKLKQTTTAYFSDYRFNYNDITSNGIELISDFEKKNVIFDSGISTEFNLEFNNNKRLTFGYQYSLKDVAYAFINTTNLSIVLDQDKTVLQSHGLFGNYEIKNKWFDAFIGFRTNYYKELDAVRFEPRLLIYKPLLKNLKLQVSAEIKNQVISEIDETILSDLSLENRLWRLSNSEEFPIINSFQVSTGFIFTKNGWSIDIDNYYKKLTNISALSLGFLNPENSNFNIGNQSIYGIDVFVMKRFKGFNTWFSYSFNDSKSQFKNLNEGESFISRSNVKHALTTAFSYDISKFQLALSWRWQTGKPYTKSDNGANGLEFNYGINTERLPNYHRLDFSSTYKFKFSSQGKLKGKIGLSIRNVYNKSNLISREYIGNNDLNRSIEQIDKYSLGFTPNLMFRMYW